MRCFSVFLEFDDAINESFSLWRYAFNALIAQTLRNARLNMDMQAFVNLVDLAGEHMLCN